MDDEKLITLGILAIALIVIDRLTRHYWFWQKPPAPTIGQYPRVYPQPPSNELSLYPYSLTHPEGRSYVTAQVPANPTQEYVQLLLS